jgi:predicted ATPase/DNA-binding SARP family transcriptional activator
MLEVRLLGRFQVSHNGNVVVITSRPAQTLFAYLILNTGTPHRREKLAGMLWPDSLEETARDNLRHALWRLRKSLPSISKAAYLLTDDLSIVFNPAADYWLDAGELERLSQSASTDTLITVLSNYQGELLPGFYEEWVVLEREHLSSIFEHHMARLMSLLQEEKRWLDVLDWGERWIRLGQKPEPAYRALMLAHAAKGDRSKVAATYERCVKSLKEWGVEPSEQTRALYESLKSSNQTFDIEPTAPSQKEESTFLKTNLPVPLTSFVGREREIESVKQLLSSTRLLTLIGAGGIGKTRLATQAASELTSSYRHGVLWVELASLTEGALVPQAVAHVLDVRESPNKSLNDSMKAVLGEKHVLLILDNCEHLISACATLAYDLLSHCANLKILATSREALNLTGETILRVPALSFPGLGDISQLQNLQEFESIQLFAERAAAVQPDLALTSESALAITQICHRLDGIPLALELAAARVKSLPLEEIASRLDHRLHLLTQGSRVAPARHQTLRATIDWSYELLPEPERVLLRRLSVFAGGFQIDAAEAVAAAGDVEKSQVLDLLEHLIDKSLVIPQKAFPAGEEKPRYGFLETIREYAREKLTEAGEEAQVRRRHLDFFAAFAQRAQNGIYSPEQVSWFRRLDQEIDNLRVALDCPDVDPVDANRLGSRSILESQFVIIRSLSLFWERGFRAEIVETLKKLLLRDHRHEPTAERARALDVGGFLLWSLNRLPEARAYLEASIQIAEKLRDDSLLVWPLMYLGWTFWGLGEYERAKESLEKSLEIGKSLGENGRGAVAVALAYLGDIPYAQGHVSEARRLYEEALVLLRELQNPSMLTPSLRRLAYVEVRDGNFVQAFQLFRECFELNRQLGHEHGMVACLAGFASIHLAKGNLERAAILYGCVENLLRTSGQPFMFTDTVEYERGVTKLKQSMEEKTLAAAWSKGSWMTLKQATGLALEGVI